jgi:hypothetical protein
MTIDAVLIVVIGVLSVFMAVLGGIVSSTEPKIRATFIVLGVASVICIVWESRVIPKPLSVADVQSAAAVGAEQGIEKHTSGKMPNPQNDVDSQKSVISAAVAAVVRANRSKPETVYLAGMSDLYLAAMARDLSSKIAWRKNELEAQLDGTTAGFSTRTSEAKTPEEREKLRGELAHALANLQVKYDKDMELWVRDADLARKAILQRLGSYPPTNPEDKQADQEFSKFSEVTVDQFDGYKNGHYLGHLSSRLVP